MRKTARNSKWLSILLMVFLIIGLGIVPASNGLAHIPLMQSVIVQGQSTDQAAQVVAKYGGQVTSRLDIIQGAAALLPQASIDAVRAEQGILRVTPNAITQLSDLSFESAAKDKTPVTDYPDVTGADFVWQQGVTGQGVTVAIVDTGIDAQLLKLQGNKNHKLLGWVDFIDGKNNPTDPNGHGTHIAGIISNAEIGSDHEWNGIAPDVNLVAVRVLDKTGVGTYESVINGIQWVVEHQSEYNIKVLNLSLCALVQSPYWADPLNQAVMHAWDAGITVVVSAGNSGPGPLSISVPGNVPYVITVGAFTDHFTPDDWSDDTVTPFSSAGPTLDNFVKPDVVAPGAHMVSTMSSSSYIARQHDANRLDNRYFSMAGTSQAAAVVSGISALILSNNPGLSPDQVKYQIMFTALPWVNKDGSDVPYSIWQQGTGRVNAYDAVFQNLGGSANQGMDIQADLAGNTHYEGYTYFDEETGTFRLGGEYGSLIDTSLGAWSGRLGIWSGSYYGSWASGLGAWSGRLGIWSGGLGVWSGRLGAWSGRLGAWSGKLGVWSGSLGTWSGGYSAWADKLGVWSGRLGVWSGSLYIDPAFIATYNSGSSPTGSSTSTSLAPWIEEPTVNLP